MIRQNLHTHSIWDDGQNTLEQLALAAKAAGLTSLGFSAHSYLPFAREWTLAPERQAAYIEAVRALKRAFAGELTIYNGMEWDILSEADLSAFDYIIGSVHQIVVDGEAYSVDSAPETTAQYLNGPFRGDADAAASAYFAQYAALSEVEEVDIVGHFDLLTKYDETNGFFREDSGAFHEAACLAMDALIAEEKIFEINTGAISRGYRTMPYPSRALLEELQRRGGRITISSDAHSAAHVAFGFAEAERLALDCGFTQTWQFDGRAFVPVRIGGSA